MWNYIWLVLRRTGKETWETIGINRQTLFSVLVYLVVLFLNWLKEGREAVMNEVNSLWAFVLKPTLIAVIILFILSVIRAAYLIHKESEEKVKQAEAEREHANQSLADEKTIKDRPKLIGFFQDCVAHGWTKPGVKDEPRRERVMLPPKPTGTLVVLKVAFVNENPTPTTLHNFSLTIKVGDKTFRAKYPEELPELDEHLPPEILAREKERRKANLINYLDTSKTAEQGHRIQGTLIFYLDGFMWEEFSGLNWLFTLSITDAWNEKHDIVHWGERPRPSQRIGS